MIWGRGEIEALVTNAPYYATAKELAEYLTAAWGEEITPSGLKQAYRRAVARGWAPVPFGDIIGSHAASQRVSGGVVTYDDDGGCDVLGSNSVISYPSHARAYALWSDTHAGSDDCNEVAITRYQEICLSYGVTNFLHSGDWCDGSYTKRGGQHEQRQIGLDKQIARFLELVPYREGVNHWIIDGNHEHTFYVAGGTRPGEHLQATAESMGRDDIHFLGYPRGSVTLDGITFELVHHKRGVRKAHISHFMNRPDDSLPDVLVGGHYHIDDCTRARGVLCIQPGAFQNETDFMAGSEAHPTGGGILWVQSGEWGRVYWYAFFEFNRKGEYIGNTNPNQ